MVIVFRSKQGNAFISVGERHHGINVKFASPNRGQMHYVKAAWSDFFVLIASNNFPHNSIILESYRLLHQQNSFKVGNNQSI